MHVYEFGNEEASAIVLIPGTCCHWKSTFGEVIEPLAQTFRVVCISFTGMDEADAESGEEFTTITDEVERIEDYLLAHHNGHVRAAYGCSLGGSLVGLLVARKRVHIDRAVLGGSDLDQAGPAAARVQTALVARVLGPLIANGKFKSAFMQRFYAKHMEGRGEYAEVMCRMFGIGTGGSPWISTASIKNQFYSDLVTPLPQGIDVAGTEVHIFYALKMGEKYRERYLAHFAHPHIHELDMQHEELLACHPSEWVELVEQICAHS